MIMVVNASNTRVRNYKPFFERLASWGFIVVGNEEIKVQSLIQFNDSLAA